MLLALLRANPHSKTTLNAAARNVQAAVKPARENTVGLASVGKPVGN